MHTERVSGKSDVVQEMEEDYAVRLVPRHWRRDWLGLTNVALGVATAMVFMQEGSLLALNYGSANALYAEIYATLMAGLLGVIIARTAGWTGLNANLLSRGAGYGFVGSALTSFIYAINFIMYTAIEGSIMAAALHTYIPVVPIYVFYLFSGAIITPFVWRGITQLDKVEKYSVPVYAALLILSLVLVTFTGHYPDGNTWLGFLPKGQTVGGLGFISGVGVLNGLVGIMALLVSDYARFSKPKQARGFGGFGMGFIPQFVAFFLSGLIGVYLGVRTAQGNPGVYMVSIMGTLGAVFVVLTQLRINVTNLYSGSLSLSNFFARVFHFAPGRNFWVVVTAAAAVATMMFNVLRFIGPMLTFQGVFLFAWASSVVTDIYVVRRWLKLVPETFEHRRGYLRDWNPVGVTALIVASIVGCLFAFGLAGPFWAGVSAFVAGVIAAIIHTVLALATQGRYYQARQHEEVRIATADIKVFDVTYDETKEEGVACTVCHGHFVREDTLACPFHRGPICSMCCAADAQCHAVCQTEMAQAVGASS